MEMFVLPLIGTSRGAYPTARINRVPLLGAFKVNNPLSLLEVPCWVPFTKIEAPTIGSPSALVTFPAMDNCCAESICMEHNDATAIDKQVGKFIFRVIGY